MLSNMKIGVIGGGVVGGAVARSYKDHHEVRVFDLLEERRTHSIGDVLACHLVFVCLPTPQMKGTLECDLSAVRNFFKYVRFASIPFVLRSTVPIGTTRLMSRTYQVPNLCHSPEFLTARTAECDAVNPLCNIIGKGLEQPLYLGGVTGILKSLYESRFPRTPTVLMSSDESEAVKLFQNGFFATKVSYWNECRSLSDRVGLDWDKVMEGVLADGRINPLHTSVPGPDGKRGFGGECLPKDLANLVDCMMQAGVSPKVTSTVLARNEHIDRVD